MIKTITEVINSEQRIHEFYCDVCNKLIGKSLEYDDGYYDGFGTYLQKIHIDNLGWFKHEKCLCDFHRLEEKQKLIDALVSLGFVKD